MISLLKKPFFLNWKWTRFWKRGWMMIWIQSFLLKNLLLRKQQLKFLKNYSAPPKKTIKQEKSESDQNSEKKDKRYSCPQPQCDFASEHHVSLKKHRLSKHEAVRFQCERCEKSYSDSSALLRHKKSVHDGVVYKCETCEKTFSEGCALTRHKKIFTLRLTKPNK
eukprot:TRINITY_DN4471_c1_g1_i1.p1 TRINITY_DN4471_c1_g1~~TRINITY_DN4471_c1_g1_i1.p1  ORF type:complete len:165 (+),score=17.26 TRINITY_DN4471_c1_g1_i1:94-588(+)